MKQIDLPELTEVIRPMWCPVVSLALIDGNVMWTLPRGDGIVEWFPPCRAPVKIEKLIKSWILSGGLNDNNL